MLRLAGEIADGVVLWACPASYVKDVVLREVAAGRARAGRELAGFDICAAVPSAVVDDPAVACDGIRTELHRYFGLPFYRAMFAQAGYDADIAAYDAAASVTAQRAAISDAFIADLCAIGKPADVAAGVARYQPLKDTLQPDDHGHRLAFRPAPDVAGGRQDQPLIAIGLEPGGRGVRAPGRWNRGSVWRLAGRRPPSEGAVRRGASLTSMREQAPQAPKWGRGPRGAASRRLQACRQLGGSLGPGQLIHAVLAGVGDQQGRGAIDVFG